MPPRPERTEGQMMVFDGGVLTPEQTAQIQLPVEELRSWAWCTEQEAAERLSELLARRIAAAVQARADGNVVYLENRVLRRLTRDSTRPARSKRLAQARSR